MEKLKNKASTKLSELSMRTRHAVSLAVLGTTATALLTWAALSYVYVPPVPTLSSSRNTEPHAAVNRAPSPFDDIVLEAKAAYVLDTTRGEPLFSYNEEAQLPLASITKLMTALVAYERLGAEGVVTIEESAIAQEGDSGFRRGERFRVQDLLDFTLLESSNDGAYALAAQAVGGAVRSDRPVATFIDRMNSKAQELGLAQTYFTNPTGLDTSNLHSGSYGSAKDVAQLMRHIIIYAGESVEATRRGSFVLTSFDNTAHTATNTNKTLREIPGLMASKTGYTNLAGGNLAVAFDAGVGYPIVVVVLGSTEEGRFRDTNKLVAASIASRRTPR